MHAVVSRGHVHDWLVHDDHHRDVPGLWGGHVPGHGGHAALVQDVLVCLRHMLRDGRLCVDRKSVV